MTQCVVFVTLLEPGAAPGDRGARESDLWPGGHRGNSLRGCGRAEEGVLQPARRGIAALSRKTQLGELRQGCHTALQG